MEDFARELQARWGCPAAGHAPPATLPPDLAEEAAHVARLTGTPLADTCPLACLSAADPWVRELTEAVGMGAEPFFVPLETTLGRDLTAADLAALKALNRARNDAAASDRDLDEREREARKKAGPPGA